MNKILCLDGYTLNPGDVPWTPFTSLGEFTVFDRTDENQIPSLAAGVPYLLTNKTKLSADTIKALPGLKYIGVLATGTNVVDVKAAASLGVTVTNVPGYSTHSVAQLVIAYILELSIHTSRHARAVADGGWARCPDFSFTVSPIAELAGKTLGVIGLGAIGQQVAKTAAALGMRIVAAHQRSMATVSIPGVQIHWLPQDQVFAEADFLTLHCPLTDQTKHLVNAQRLSLMKPTAVLINTGRGPLVDEIALAHALHQRQIGGAALDVLSTEPPKADNPLLSAPRCLITPHIGWASVDARKRLMQLAAENLRSFLGGKPINVVK